MDKTLLLETTFEKPLLLTQKSNPNNNFYFTNYRLGIEDEPQITLDYNTFQKNSDNLTSHLFGLYSKAMLINTAQKMGIDARTKKDFEEKLREKFEVYANDLEKINEDEEWKELETKLLQRYNKTINQIILSGSVQKTLKDTSTINAFFQKLKAIINKCQQAIDIINLKLNMADEGEHIVDKNQINRIEKDKKIIEDGLNELLEIQKEAKELSDEPIEIKQLFKNDSELLINKFIQNYHRTICLGVGFIYEQKAYEVCQNYFDFVKHTGADNFIDKNGNKQHDRKTDMIINELNISFKTISKGKKQNKTSNGTAVQSKGRINSGDYLKEIVKDNDKDLAVKVLSSQKKTSLSKFLRYTMFLKAIAGEKNKYQDDTIDVMIDNKHGVRLMGDIFSLLEEDVEKANVIVNKIIKSNKFDSFDIQAQYFLKENF